MRNYGEMELLGREPERAMLGEILETSHRSGGSTLVLHGTVGIGKSALLRLAETEARQRGMSVLSVTAVPTEARLPYAGIDQPRPFDTRTRFLPVTPRPVREVLRRSRRPSSAQWKFL